MEKQKKWFVAAKKADFNKLSKKYGISPITARCIVNRDVSETDVGKYLFGKRSDMYNAKLLLNAELAAKHIKTAIKAKKKIRIIGDYDVDGVMASEILNHGLTKCGANVDYIVPHRIEDGYGLNENLIRKAYEDGIDMIITCDNGIAAKDQINLANELGMQVIVTDHHEVPYVEVNGEKEYVLPEALVVVDPKQPNETYPFIGICGALVAFKVIDLLYELYRIPKKELDFLLQFAAFATVCDVMELKDENRIVVREGLRVINETPCKGIEKLIEATGLSEKTITAGHLGFILGPCVNASGRLDTALKAIELLEETDDDKAMLLAIELKNLNDDRKHLTEEKVAEALHMIETTSLNDDMILTVKIDDCHESIAGIIAGRIRERYNKPTLVFTDVETGLKGSGRSTEAYNMFEELNKHRDMFIKFGGHKMAAGMSVDSIDILNAIRKILNEETTLTEDDLAEITHIDMELPIEYATLELANDLKLLEPFGVANSSPLFAIRDLQITRAVEMGAKHNAMRYHVKTKYGLRSVVYDFGNIDVFINHLKEKYGETVMEDLAMAKRDDVFETITYKLDVNSYNGKDNVQIVMDNFK